MTAFRFFDRVRSVARRARSLAAFTATVAFYEVGGRIGLPGVDGGRVQDFLYRTGRFALYSLMVGGSLSRAALLALGALPYLQARLYVWLAREAFPRVRRTTGESGARRSVVLVTTAGLAVVQSIGFAEFLQTIPGAVAAPGVGFVARSVLLLTGGAVAIGWLAEMMAGWTRTDDGVEVRPADASPTAASTTDAPAVVIADETLSALSALPASPLLTSGAVVEVPFADGQRAEAPVGRDAASLR